MSFSVTYSGNTNVPDPVLHVPQLRRRREVHRAPADRRARPALLRDRLPLEHDAPDDARSERQDARAADRRVGARLLLHRDGRTERHALHRAHTEPGLLGLWPRRYPRQIRTVREERARADRHNPRRSVRHARWPGCKCEHPEHLFRRRKSAAPRPQRPRQ